MSRDHEDIALSPPGAAVDPARAGRTLPLAPREGEATLALPIAPAGTLALPVAPAGTLPLAVGSDVTPATFALEAAEARALPPSRDSLPVIDEDRYIVEREVARGGMGRVLLAQDRRLRRPVAVKEMLSADAAELVRRFEREALLTARLQHPSIVSVHEAGRWPSGAPFYTMELVRGRSLEDAIAAAQSLPERMALLVQAIAAVEALGYAHSQHVVHRDLKPANIMVGSFGETVVIDWGLAKDLSDPHDDGGRAAPSASMPDADGGLTGVGAIVGTPMYMSPEQASGALVNERSDVYSLGAILYHLLAGATPFESGSTGELLMRVRSRRRPEALGVRAPGVPSDLVAIVEKAMSPAPEERYPTAAELAADLKRFQTGQLVGAHAYTLGQLARRWLRRHRLPVTIAAIAVAILVAVSAYGATRILHERDAATAARQVAEEQRTVADLRRVEAETRRSAAEKLVEYVLGDLKSQLDRVGRVDLLRGVTDEVDHYYQAIEAVSDAQDDEARARRAAALYLLGDALDIKGDLTGAHRALDGSLKIREALVAAHPGDARHVRDRAATRIALGLVRLEQGASEEAARYYQQAIDELDALAPVDRESSDTRGVQGLAYQRLGTIEEGRLNFAAAKTAYSVSLDLRLAALAPQPNDRMRRFDVSRSHDRMSDVLRRISDFSGALRSARASLKIRQELAHEDPGNPDYVVGEAVCWDKIGAIFLFQGDEGGALAASQKQLEIIEALVARDAMNADWQVLLVNAYLRAGELAWHMDELKGAVSHLKRALAVAERVLELDPDNLERLKLVELVCGQLGAYQIEAKQIDEGLASVRRALRIATNGQRLFPKDMSFAYSVGSYHEEIGDALLDRGDAGAAETEYNLALAVTEELLTQESDTPQYRMNQGRLHYALGMAISRNPERFGEAVAHLQRAVDIHEALAKTTEFSAQDFEQLNTEKQALESANRHHP